MKILGVGSSIKIPKATPVKRMDPSSLRIHQLFLPQNPQNDHPSESEAQEPSDSVLRW